MCFPLTAGRMFFGKCIKGSHAMVYEKEQMAGFMRKLMAVVYAVVFAAGLFHA